MIRKNTNGDISDEEFEAILKPFIDDYDNFVISYIMPEVIVYYIANSYYRGSMYKGAFLQHYNSAKDLINLLRWKLLLHLHINTLYAKQKKIRSSNL